MRHLINTVRDRAGTGTASMLRGAKRVVDNSAMAVGTAMRRANNGATQLGKSALQIASSSGAGMQKAAHENVGKATILARKTNEKAGIAVRVLARVSGRAGRTLHAALENVGKSSANVALAPARTARATAKWARRAVIACVVLATLGLAASILQSVAAIVDRLTQTTQTKPR